MHRGNLAIPQARITAIYSLYGSRDNISLCFTAGRLSSRPRSVKFFWNLTSVSQEMACGRSGICQFEQQLCAQGRWDAGSLPYPMRACQMFRGGLMGTRELTRRGFIESVGMTSLLASTAIVAGARNAN